MIHFTDRVLMPWLGGLTDWSVRWAIVIAVVAVWFSVRAPRRTELRYLLCWSVLLVGILVPVMPTWGPGLSLPGFSAGSFEFVPEDVEVTGAEAPPITGVSAESGLPITQVMPEEPVPNESSIPTPTHVPPVYAAPLTRPQLGWERGFVLTLAFAWLAGVSICLLRLLGGLLWLARLRKTVTPLDATSVDTFRRCCLEVDLRRPADIAAHRSVGSPVIVGLFRPLILVPRDWAALGSRSQRAILLHELKHVAGYHDWSGVATELVRAIFFFHPAVHWLVNRINLERELLCDEAALGADGSPLDHAEVLLNFSRRGNRLSIGRLFASQAVSTLLGHPKTIKARIERLLNPAVDHWPTPWNRSWRISVAVILVILIGGVGSVKIGTETRSSLAGETATGGEIAREEEKGPVPALVTVTGFSEDIRFALFTPDDRRLLTGGHDKLVRVFDMQTGKLLRTLQGHAGGITCGAVSPDGKMLATGSWDRTIRLWDIESGRKVATLLGHEAEIRWLAFSPNGKPLASAGGDKVVRLWDVITQKELRTLPAQDGPVNSVAVSPDGSMLATATGDWREPEEIGEVKLWDLATGKELQTLPEYLSRYYGVSFSPDGKVLAFADADGWVRLWDIAKRSLIAQMKSPTGLFSVAFIPEGNLLATTEYLGSVSLWDVSTGDRCVTYEGHEGIAYAVASSADGTVIVTAGADDKARIWSTPNDRGSDATTASRIRRWVETSPGKSGGGDGKTVRFASLEERRTPPLATLTDFERDVRFALFTPDDRRLLTGGHDKLVRVFDMRTGKLLQTLQGHAGGITCGAVSPDGKMLATGSWDKTIRLWDIESGREAATLLGHEAEICWLAFSPNGKPLASAGGDKVVRLWDVITQKELRTLPAQDGPVNSVAVSPDGSMLATATGDWREPEEIGEVKLWDLATGKELQTLPDYFSRYFGVSFSPNGKVLAFGDALGWVRLWDIAQRSLIGRMKDPGRVFSVASIPEGNLLATTQYRGGVSLWDVSTGDRYVTYEGHEGIAYAVASSADGTVIVTAGADDKARIWSTPNDRGSDATTASRIRRWAERGRDL